MKRRTIKTFVAVNVIAGAALYIWFTAIPEFSHVSSIAQDMVDQSTQLDPATRLELITQFRDAWEHRATHYLYWAIVAGTVIAANAALFFWHLIAAESGEMVSTNHPLQLTRDARES